MATMGITAGQDRLMHTNRLINYMIGWTYNSFIGWGGLTVGLYDGLRHDIRLLGHETIIAE